MSYDLYQEVRKQTESLVMEQIKGNNSFDELTRELENNGVKTVVTNSANDKIIGVRFDCQGVSFNGSLLNYKLSAANIQKSFGQKK